jgi:hypothetical protein
LLLVSAVKLLRVELAAGVAERVVGAAHDTDVEQVGVVGQPAEAALNDQRIVNLDERVLVDVAADERLALREVALLGGGADHIAVVGLQAEQADGLAFLRADADT